MPANLVVPASSIFIYSSRSGDNLKPPLSPTSSIKGCFVRSRPTSTEFSEYEFTEFPNFGAEPTSSSSEGSDVSSDTDDLLDHIATATGPWAAAQINRDFDTRSLASSMLTMTDGQRRPLVPVRITRRSDAEMDAGALKQAQTSEVKTQQSKDKAAVTSRRRTWPSYKAIRKTVSNIIHRRDAPTMGGKGSALDSEPAAPTPVKSSSASLFTKRRRVTVSGSEDKAKAPRPSLAQRALSSRSKMSSSEIQHRAQLRRSRSFSGFTNVLSVINDAADDEDLDEATTEARSVVLDIRQRWNFEEVPEDAALMFERCIE